MIPQELIAAFRAARKVRIGHTLYIGDVVGLDATIKQALARGLTVVENGISKWFDESPVFDSTKSGSAAYVWRGDKIKVVRILVTKTADGKVSRAPAGFTWRNFS